MTAKPSDNDANSREHWKRAVSNPKEFGLSNRQVQAMSESLKLTDPDYWKRVKADPEAYGFNAAQATHLAEWGTNTRQERHQEKTQLTPAEKIEEESGFHIGSYPDQHVQTWLTMVAVSPQEAALLFFFKNPFKYKGGLPFMADEFDSMNRSFEDAARDGRNRNLRDWIALARDRNLYGNCIEGWEACITVSENKYRRCLASEITFKTKPEIAKWEKMGDGGIPSEALAIKKQLAYLRDRLGKLETLFNHPAVLLKGEMLTDAELDNAILAAAHADTQTQMPPGMKADKSSGVEPRKRGKRKSTIESVSLNYMRKEYRTGEFKSATVFHKHLCKVAGEGESPFQMGTGSNARKLFCREASSYFDSGTLGKMWPKIRAR